MNYLLLLTLFFITERHCLPQVISASQYTPSELKRFAKNAELTGDIYSAISYYTDYLHLKKDPDIIQKLAELYKLSKNYAKAQEYFGESYQENPVKNIEDCYYYALMLKMNGKYSEAKEYFIKFKKSYKGKNLYYYNTIIANEIKGCDMAMNEIKRNKNIDLELMNETINNPHTDMAPFPVDDSTMLYTSVRTNNHNAETFTEESKYSKIYAAGKNDTSWINAGEFEIPFLLKNMNIGNTAMSPDRNRLYFTCCKTNLMNEMICKIVVSRKENGCWQEPQELDKLINHPSYTSTQPAVGMDIKNNREILYFVSDRPGGKGGTDVWYSLYNPKTGSFEKPINTGSKINTPGDEVTPFYDHSSQTLYFSSNGLPGIGGFDIFKTCGEKRNWNIPVNLGDPVNSSVDDIYYSLYGNHREGFLVSNRPGGFSAEHSTCCDDIYYFKIKDYSPLYIKGYLSVNKNKLLRFLEKKYGTTSFYSSGKKNSPAGSVVFLYIIDKSLEDPIYIASDTVDTNGEYLFVTEKEHDYRIVVEKDNQLQAAKDFIYPKKSTGDTLFAETIEMMTNQEEMLVLNNIYFNFNDYELTDESKIFIDSTIVALMDKFPIIGININAHTDSIGTEQYNINLSEKRAFSVMQYLISKGIDESRLTARGYGNTQPVAVNHNPDGTDNPEGRAKNRRTEIKIVNLSEQLATLPDLE